MRIIFLLSVLLLCLLAGRIKGNDQNDLFAEDFQSVGRQLLQGGCTDEAPAAATFKCRQYADLGLCGILEDRYCQQSCGECCSDVVYPDIGSCETVVTLGLCEHEEIRGIYCNISCDNCNIMPEYEALLVFRDAIYDPFLLGDWNGTDPCSGWTGVTCVQGRVDSIEYFGADVETSIPPEFSELKQLRRLLLGDDGITGTLPPELSKLENIQVFDLENHEIRGTLPVEYSAWTNIEVFNLAASAAGSVGGTLPPEFSTWLYLENFDMNGNRLSGTLPPEFSTWSNNKELQLSENRISGFVPEEYSLWNNYEDLYLSPQSSRDFCITRGLESYLTYTISSYDIDELTYCTFSSDIFQTTSINLEANALYAFKNSISYPSILMSWKGDDPCDNWNGITCENNKVITVEYPSSTDVDISIPPEFSELKELRKLTLSDVAITGTLPPELSVLQNLEEFDLENHDMRGSLPVQFSTWTNIQIFDMEASYVGQLSGTLPPEFSTWTSLVSFDLLENSISGTLPPEFSTWSNNRYIQLSENRISGSVPEIYSLWNRYDDLYLEPQFGGDFCISSSLESYLTRTVSDYDIDLLPSCTSSSSSGSSQTSSSNLEANALYSFKKSIRSSSALYSWQGDDPCDYWSGITCENNKVIIVSYSSSTSAETSIPPEFSDLKQLQKLTLSYDDITGTLPPELSELEFLEELNLEDHQLRGTLPPQFSTWKNIETFDLEASSSGSVSGTLPPQFSTWTNLVSFDMLENALSGTLPAEYSAWSRNKYVQLSENRITGSVPEEYSLWNKYDDLYLEPQNGGDFCISAGLESYLTSTVSDYDITSLPSCTGSSSSFGSPSQTTSSNPEANALYQFKNSIPSSSILFSWQGDDPCDNWGGITCRSNQVFTVEYTSSTAVETSIPPEFSDLKGLRKLILSNDAITGTLPPELSELEFLEEFQLEDHELRGTLPPQFSMWKNIQIFDLEASSSGSVSGTLPPQFSTWTNLESFDMLENALSGTLPPEYSAWSFNKYVQLSENRITGSVPEEYSLWRNYDDLYLEPQNGRDFCISPGLESYLTSTVSDYDIDSLPLCTSSFSTPSPFGSSQNSSSNVEANALYSFKNSIRDSSVLFNWQGDDPCDNWSGITCRNNQVITLEYTSSLDAETSIPPEFSDLKALQQLTLSNDAITGTLPPELSELENIEEFVIEQHEMRGTLPAQFSTWKNIEIFNLEASSSGALSGTLPIEYSTWTDLQSFDMLENALSGTLPPEYSAWSFNRYVQLSENRITGSVPEEYSLWYRYDDLLLAPQNGGDFCIPEDLYDFLNLRVATNDIDELSFC